MQISSTTNKNGINVMKLRNVCDASHPCEFKMNNNAMNKPAGDLSFGGFSISNVAAKLKPYLRPDRKAGDTIEMALKANVPKWADKLAKNKTFEKVLVATRDNPAIVQALVELGIVGVVRTGIVFATPGVKKGDKQTSAAKNIVSAITGYTLANIVFKPIGKASKKVLQNPDKYITNPKILEKIKGTGLDEQAERSYKTAFHNFWNKGPDILMAPLKSALTVALIPVVMAAFTKIGQAVSKKSNPKEAQGTNIQAQPTQAPQQVNAQAQAQPTDISNLIINKNIQTVLGSMPQKGAQ